MPSDLVAEAPAGFVTRSLMTEFHRCCTLCGGPLGTREPGGGVRPDGRVVYSMWSRLKNENEPEMDWLIFSEEHVVCHDCMEDFPDDALYAWMARHNKGEME